ncbi:G protein-coupled receptor gpr1 [Didymella sp. IMI 355093]|nr:G protein-coupled receptor gpr1 [Didymella sp. IMI 355093]
MQPRPQPTRRKSSIGHEIFSSWRQNSSAPALNPFSTAPKRLSFESGTVSYSLPGSILNLSRCPDTTRSALHTIPSGQSITTPISPRERSDDKDTYVPEPTATPVSSSPRTPSPSSPAQIRLAKQRQRIHRQLRLMFIYPIVYTLMWLIPFAMHCMNYWDKYALNPIEFLSVGSSICIALMGFADALIFSLREKPWRSIDGSDGTFWGSLVWTRRAHADVEVNAAGNEAPGSSEPRPRRGSRSHRTSASGDFARIAAEQARQRLDLEREERLKALGDGQEKDKDGADAEHGGLNVGDGKKGQVYDDNGLEDDTAKTEYNSRKD